MSETIEIVRFTVPPSRARELVDGHEAARVAIDAVAPGWVWSRLARVDDRAWVEVVAWREREAFVRALERSARDPVASAWFELADPGWTLRIGARTGDAEGPPPHTGTLELRSSPGADLQERWSAAVELEGRTWTGEAWRTSPPEALHLEISDGGGAPIEHACDAEAARSPAA